MVRRLLFVGVVTLGVASVATAQDAVVPVSASSPHVVVSLTTERDIDDTSFFSIPSPQPPRIGGVGGTSMPVNEQPYYAIATYDTGSPATIIGRDEFESFDIAGAGRDGFNVTQVGGVGEGIDAINSDPIGVYASGFDTILQQDPLFVDRTLMKGTFNDSILYAPAGADLPNLIGTTTSSHYTTTIKYGEPQILNWIDGETYRSPSTELHTLGSVTAPNRRLGMTLVSGALGAPAYLPDLANFDFDDLSNNPSTPTIAGNFYMRANVKNNGVERTGVEMILDTGAQGSIVSEQIAAEMGFDVIRDDPDFVVRIAGVTGVAEEVPGFYADEFQLPGTDGGLVLKNVPLIVFNLTDPRDGMNTLPGLIGMNLFWDRNITLNPQPGSSYLGVSDPVVDVHRWTSQSDSGSWANASNWGAPGVPELGWLAILENVSGVPQVATIESDSTVGNMQMAGGEGEAHMTVRIENDVTLELFGTAIIQDGSTLDMQGGRLSPVAVEVRGGTISGHGDVGGEVLSQGTLIPGSNGGIGKLNFIASFDQLSRGAMQMEIAGNNNADLANPQYDTVDAGGDISVDGRLVVVTTEAYVGPGQGETDQFSLITAGNTIIGEFDEITFNGTLIEKEFQLGSDPRDFIDHVGNGQFLGVSFASPGTFSLRNYQALAGDTDGDGEVAFNDFLPVSEFFGQGDMEWVHGDFTGDGLVAFPDFLLLASNFGQVARGDASAAAVPEPATLTLLLTSLAAFAIRRRQSR